MVGSGHAAPRHGCGPRPTHPRLTARVPVDRKPHGPRLTARVNPTILDAMLRISRPTDGRLDMVNLGPTLRSTLGWGGWGGVWP